MIQALSRQTYAKDKHVASTLPKPPQPFHRYTPPYPTLPHPPPPTSFPLSSLSTLALSIIPFRSPPSPTFPFSHSAFPLPYKPPLALKPGAEAGDGEDWG